MIPYRSAIECAADIRSKEVSPVEVLDAYLARVDQLDPSLNAFAFRDDERAHAEAQVAAEIVANTQTAELPPFIGVPIPIKDLNSVEGWPTTLGSNAVADKAAETDDQVVARLRVAGFVLMGKTTTPEFGSISVTESQRFGATRNPWNTDHTPGGSSGGAGAAVAAGMAPIAHASDGGGSIRIPASCTGLVGLKPSRNRVTELTEKLSGASTSGVLARSVADSAALLDVIAEFDDGAWNNAPVPTSSFSDHVGQPPGKLRIRVAQTNALGIPVAAACSEAASQAADLLADLGHDVTESDPEWPEAGAFLQAFLTVWSTITSGVEGLISEKLEPHNRASRMQAEATSSLAYAEALLSLQGASRLVTSQFGRDFDVLVTPTMAIEPPQVGWIWSGAEDDPSMPLVNATPMAAYTAMFNVTGQPAISLPLHKSDLGLPVGVQFVGAPWAEATLIRLAAEVESVAPWVDDWPELAL